MTRRRSSPLAAEREQISAKRRVFEDLAPDYDQWFDDNAEVYRAQVRLLKRGIRESGSMLEVGVGSGRFAAPLGIRYGIDLSLPLARMAQQRGIEVTLGCAEHLPYRKGSFDTVVMMTIICFLDNIAMAFCEARRVLAPGGRIFVGFLERGGEIWHTYHAEPKKGRFLRHARFYSLDEVRCELSTAGFSPAGICARERGFCLVAAFQLK
jgi:ubiquinone/menaquinone biosynthesis C-methylase UbiE